MMMLSKLLNQKKTDTIKVYNKLKYTKELIYYCLNYLLTLIYHFDISSI